MNVRLKILLSLLAVTLQLGCSTSSDIALQERRNARKDYAAARIEAQQDIARGHLAYEVHGFPPPSTPLCKQLLRDRYGVELRVVGGCVVDESVAAHAQGYNEIMKPEIERRFGSNIWTQTETDAQRLYESKH